MKIRIEESTDKTPTTARTAVKYNGTFFTVKAENRMSPTPSSMPIIHAIAIAADIFFPFRPHTAYPLRQAAAAVLFEVQLIFQKIICYTE